MADSGIVRFLLRLPAEIHAELKELAEGDRRSIHAEILVLLEEAIAKRKEEPESKLAA